MGNDGDVNCQHNYQFTRFVHLIKRGVTGRILPDEFEYVSRCSAACRHPRLIALENLIDLIPLYLAP
jgi:hypothetical protein